MPRRFHVFYLAAVITACGCPVTRAADEDAKHLDKCNSWIATARMVAEAWLDDELPQHYAAATLAKAAAKLYGIPACGDIGRLVSELHSAVSASEARGVRQALAHLDAPTSRRRTSK